MYRALCVWLWILGLAAVLLAADSTHVPLPISAPANDSLRENPPDTSAGSDSLAIPAHPRAPLRPFKKLTPHLDTLLKVVYGTRGDGAVSFDLPQATSRFDYDPLLARFSSSYWGEFESLYPAGLSPSMVSCVDPLTGDGSFADPVPVPGSEEFLRMPPTSRYYLLSPSLSGIGSPFGRPFAIYRQEELTGGDTSRSQIFVTHGTGGFANTAFTFSNRVGPLGIVNVDGTLIRRNADYSYTGTKLNRFRLVSRPTLAPNLDATFAGSINRLNGDKIFYSPTNIYYGDLSDNYSALSAQATYYRSETVNYSARASYRNDDQRITFDSLGHHQRFQSTDLHVSRLMTGSRYDLEITGDARYLRYVENETAHNPIYYSIGASNLMKFSERISGYGNVAVRGSSDLVLKPSLVLAATYSRDSLNSLSIIGSHGLLMPQPEMQYLHHVVATFEGPNPDYRLSGDAQLESGTSNGIELSLRSRVNKCAQVKVRGGYTRFDNLPQWEVYYLVYANGDYQVVATDENLVFASLTTDLSLPKGIFGHVSYGFRKTYEKRIDLTQGPQHTASGYAGIRFPIHKIKIMVSAAVGGRFRSVTNRLFGDGSDDSRFLTEAYLSFDLKSFHMFWNYANLLDIQYNSGGFRQPGRAIWWGFTWAFVD